METKKLGFGYMRLPLINEKDRKSFDEEQIFKMVDMFMERGFTYFDTAYMYHEYESENMLRKALVERYPREAYTVADKMPTMLLKSADDVDRIFNEQLKKVGVDYFDYYLMHSLVGSRQPMVEEYDCFGYAAKKKQEGKIKYLGFSFHDDAETLEKILRDHPEVDFVQLQINYLDWENRSIQSRANYETALRHGKKIIVMEPVKGGSLVNLPEEALAMMTEAAPGMSPASWAIRFAAGLDGVMMVLSGMSSIEQMDDNTLFMSDFKRLSPHEEEILEKVKEIILNSDTVPCTSCRYCVEGCPKGIDIPEYFALYNAELDPNLAKTFGNEKSGDIYRRLGEAGGKASECISCGACVSVCPQHISIPEELSKVAKTFED